MNSMNIDEKINFLFNEIKLLKQNNASSFDQKINIMNNKIDNISDTLNKKEDDIKNIINEKDSIIKDLKEKLLKQENEIQKMNNKIQEIKNIINELILFKENITSKIDQLKNIDNTQITYSYEQIVFQSKEFNSLFLDEFKKIFSFNSNLSYFKEIHTELMTGKCHLALEDLNSRGNKFECWSKNQKRGNFDYFPPNGWIGIGLNVWQKFDNGDNTWIGNNNSKGEWAVAYHGLEFNEWGSIQKILKSIYDDGFKPGFRQAYQDCEDLNHKGCKVGIGVDFYPFINDAESYSCISNLNGIKHKIVIMVRIKPSSIRMPDLKPDKWIVNGKSDEVRPYRILFKRC